MLQRLAPSYPPCASVSIVRVSIKVLPPQLLLLDVLLWLQRTGQRSWPAPDQGLSVQSCTALCCSCSSVDWWDNPHLSHWESTFPECSWECMLSLKNPFRKASAIPFAFCTSIKTFALLNCVPRVQHWTCRWQRGRGDTWRATCDRCSSTI